ncbi:MAG: PDZ domain-containing protein [Ruminococcaceae bacterium]|nr:PDZ domain-containing protein [Oscillospiraceae bacterium]
MKKIYNRSLLLTLSIIIILSITSVIPVLGVKYDKVDVGGMPFGVKFYSKGLVVVGFTEIETEIGMKTPAYDAGLRVNDIITHVNGDEVKTSDDFIKKIEESDSAIQITYVRDGNNCTVSFTPSLSTDGKKRTGMWIRDTTAGIGTVTYMIHETGEFAGLGHGICDSDTGELLKMDRGTVVDVQISGISKGVAGTPGELKGYFTSDKSGVLLGNTVCGVYGVMSDAPDEVCPQHNIEVADRSEVYSGKACIWCTVDSDGPCRYEIEIGEINRDSKDNRSFEVTVIDPALLSKTGGIVQGMSGSPIIQNGKLIGAITHVLIGDPAKGYGIFIENMINAAE